MKLTSFTVAATLLFTSNVAVFAANKSAEKPKAPKQVQKAKKPSAKAVKKPANVLVTGSYIKHEVRRDGFISNAPHPVYVIDSDAIRNSGASDIRELLTRRGATR